MTALDSFTNELAELVDSYNGLLAYTDILGSLEMVKFELFNELREGVDE
tara:strand:- start:577 stop:723 length:147 start_codon:yes stop_codon:yes gene_type:complete